MGKPIVLFPDPLDSAYQISWIPEANIPFPYVYRFYIRLIEGKKGTVITPNSLSDFWAEYPSPDDVSYNDEDRVLTSETPLAVRINIKTLLTRSAKEEGLFLLSAHLYNTEDEVLAEREQSVYLKIIKNGLKPPTLP